MNGQNLGAFLVVVNIEGCRDKPAVYEDPEILYIPIEPEYLKSKMNKTSRLIRAITYSGPC